MLSRGLALVTTVAGIEVAFPLRPLRGQRDNIDMRQALSSRAIPKEWRGDLESKPLETIYNRSPPKATWHSAQRRLNH